MKGILLSTTNMIQGVDIEKYINLVFSNVVIGTNVFSDIGASFTDFFGGTSGIYEGKLEKMRNIAISEIKTKASNMGANAIIGLKVDFDEISGKGKSMFMISVTGTAVKIKHQKPVKDSGIDDLNISFEELGNEITKRNVLFQLKSEIFPSEDQWEILINYPDCEIMTILFPFYLEQLKRISADRDSVFMSNYYTLLKKVERNSVVNLLYGKLSDCDYSTSIKVAKIIYDNFLFEPEKVINLIQNKKIKEAILCLSASKGLYSKEDILLMKRILNYIDMLPDTGRIESVKNGLISKVKERFICENGHKNDINIEFCLDCDSNIKGLSSKDVERVYVFEKRINYLEYLSSIKNKE